MIVYKIWIKTIRAKDSDPQDYPKKFHLYAGFEGWYLFGIIPLYIRQTTVWK